MYTSLEFSLEVVDGHCLGRLFIPFSQIARWLNFLTSPHYSVQIVYTEQASEGVMIYFDAYEEIYDYLSDRVPAEAKGFAQQSPLLLAG